MFGPHSVCVNQEQSVTSREFYKKLSQVDSWQCELYVEPRDGNGL